MEAMDAGKITLGLELGLILFYVGAAGNCTVSVSQPPVLEVDYTQGAVTVPCSFSTTGCPSQPPTSLWFRLGAQQLESLCSDGCQSEADKFTVRTDLAHSQVSLTVNRVTANDSAIYICGIAVTSSKAPQAKRAGEGTVLVVRGTRVLGKEVRWLLTALTSLLSIYLVGLVVVFSVLSASKPNTRRNKETEDSQKKMSARRIFQEIAQELYRKGQHLRKQKRTLQLRRTVGALLPSAPSPRAWQRRQRPWTLTHQLSMTQSQVDGKTAVPADGDTAANSYRNTEARQKTPGNRFSNVLQES